MLAGSSRKVASTTSSLSSGLARLGQNASKSRITVRHQQNCAQFSIARPQFLRQTTSVPRLSTATSVRSVTTTATTTAAKVASTSAPSAAQSSTTIASNPGLPLITNLSHGLKDPLPTAPPTPSSASEQVDWSRSFQGLSDVSFSEDAITILLEPVATQDIEIKPDGAVYLPEIKYRRILNRAFGPGAWGLAPRGETIVTAKSVTREYGLVVQGR